MIQMGGFEVELVLGWLRHPPARAQGHIRIVRRTH